MHACGGKVEVQFSAEKDSVVGQVGRQMPLTWQVAL